MERTTAGWRGIISTAIANLTVASNFKEKVGPKQAVGRAGAWVGGEGRGREGPWRRMGFVANG